MKKIIVFTVLLMTVTVFAEGNGESSADDNVTTTGASTFHRKTSVNKAPGEGKIKFAVWENVKSGDEVVIRGKVETDGSGLAHIVDTEEKFWFIESEEIQKFIGKVVFAKGIAERKPAEDDKESDLIYISEIEISL